MKKHLNIVIRLIILQVLLGYSQQLYSQKDTLHIIYSGAQTEVSAANEAKVTEWVKKLNGKPHDVEIITYYDIPDFKKFMVERADNLSLIVNRKGRELIVSKFVGPMKGKKSQRSVADIVYAPVGSAPAPAAAKTEKKTATPAKEEKSDKAVKLDKKNDGEEAPKEVREEKPAAAEKSNRSDDGYVIDSTYVNGKLKIKKRKVEKLTVEEGYTIDTTYVNGVMKIKKRKLKK